MADNTKGQYIIQVKDSAGEIYDLRDPRFDKEGQLTAVKDWEKDYNNESEQAEAIKNRPYYEEGSTTKYLTTDNLKELVEKINKAEEVLTVDNKLVSIDSKMDKENPKGNGDLVITNGTAFFENGAYEGEYSSTPSEYNKFITKSSLNGYLNDYSTTIMNSIDLSSITSTLRDLKEDKRDKTDYDFSSHNTEAPSESIFDKASFSNNATFDKAVFSEAYKDKIQDGNQYVTKSYVDSSAGVRFLGYYSDESYLPTVATLGDYAYILSEYNGSTLITASVYKYVYNGTKWENKGYYSNRSFTDSQWENINTNWSNVVTTKITSLEQTVYLNYMEKRDPEGSGQLSLNGNGIIGELAEVSEDETALGNYSFGVGSNLLANGNYSVATGLQTEASGMASHAEGMDTHAQGDDSHTEGYGSTVEELTEAGHAEGYGTIAGIDGVVIKCTSLDSISEPDTATYYNLTTIENDEDGKVKYNVGYYKATITTNMNEETGEETTTIIWKSQGDYPIYGAHAEGYQTQALGKGSHAEGNKTKATASGAHAEGFNNTTSGQDSHIEGRNNTCTGNYSHVEGAGNTVDKDGCHAEGWANKINGLYSHSEGYDNIINGAYSHAEGYENVVSKDRSHAEGSINTANGYNSSVMGVGNTSNDYQIVGGIRAKELAGRGYGGTTIYAYYTYGTKIYYSQSNKWDVDLYIANKNFYTSDESIDFQCIHLIEGIHYSLSNDKYTLTILDDADEEIEKIVEKYNWTKPIITGEKSAEPSDDTYIMIMGNGLSSINKSNAFALSTSGNGHFNGNVYVNCEADSTGGTKLAPIPELPSNAAINNEYSLKAKLLSDGTTTYYWA